MSSEDVSQLAELQLEGDFGRRTPQHGRRVGTSSCIVEIIDWVWEASGSARVDFDEGAQSE